MADPKLLALAFHSPSATVSAPATAHAYTTILVAPVTTSLIGNGHLMGRLVTAFPLIDQDLLLAQPGEDLLGLVSFLAHDQLSHDQVNGLTNSVGQDQWSVRACSGMSWIGMAQAKASEPLPRKSGV